MSHLSYRTLSANKETVNKEWLLVDAADQPLGRVASKIATLIRGKHKVNFTPHVDCGDNVVVINAEKVKLSGNKWESKEYIRHTDILEDKDQLMLRSSCKISRKINRKSS